MTSKISKNTLISTKLSGENTVNTFAATPAFTLEMLQDIEDRIFMSRRFKREICGVLEDLKQVPIF